MGDQAMNSMKAGVMDAGVISGLDLSPWISVPLVLCLWIFVFSVVKTIAFALARKLAARTKTRLDDVLFDAMDFPLQLMIYATGILVAQNLIPRGSADLMPYLGLGFKMVSIIAVMLFVDKFLRGLVSLYADKVDILRISGGIVKGVIRTVIMGMGGLIILDSLGVSITPIIASLGIGSLAVALALQPTLENFFSGIQLMADKPIAPGQSVRLDSGEEGVVTKIGWRSTWICQTNNNMLIIPNKIIGNSRIINYDFPNAESVVVMLVGVPYDADLDKVERIAMEVAREVMKESSSGVPGFEPAVRYHTLGEFSISFNVVMRSRDWASSSLIKHEFIKRLQKRFAREGIPVPYPVRTMIQQK